MKYLLPVLCLILCTSLLGQPPNMQEINLYQGKFKTFLPNTFFTMSDTMKVHFYPKNELPDIVFLDTVTNYIVSFRLMPYAANESTLNNYMKSFVEGFAQLFPNANDIKANFVSFKNRQVGFIEMMNDLDSMDLYSFQYFTHLSDSLFVASISGPYSNNPTIKQLSKFVFQLSTYRDQPSGQISTLSEQLICDGELIQRTTLYKPTIQSEETEEGIIFIEIKIDRAGNVTYTKWLQDDSTTDNQILVKQCLEAARQYRFNAKSDAPTEQIAALQFTFKNQ